MSSKMVVRILSISAALILLGMVVPSLSNASGAVNPTSVLFGEVAVGSQESEVLSVSNPNEVPVPVYFLIFHINGNDCGLSLSYEGNTLTPASDGKIYLPGDSKIEAGGSITMEVIFAPSDTSAPCSATLWVVYEGVGAAQASLSGTGIEAPSVSPTVVIDGYDTGVENRLNDDKPISEHLAICEENAKNHGQYVRCVARETKKMRRAEVLDRKEMWTIIRAAAHANIPPIEEGLEGLEYDGTPVVDLIKECKENAENKKQYRRCVRKLIKKMKKEGVKTTRKEMILMLRYAAHWKWSNWHGEK